MGTVEYVECEDVAFVQVALRIKKGKRVRYAKECRIARTHILNNAHADYTHPCTPKHS